MRARLTAINSKLEELSREDSVIEGSILFDALTWTAEHSIGDALPPYPKYFGAKELWSVERSKIDLSSYPRSKAHELRDKISCLITEELSQKVGSTPTFIKILKRLSLRVEKVVLLDIYSWRDPHRASEFDEIKFRGLPGGQNSKRNDRMNALQYHVKSRGREFTRAIDALADAIETSVDKDWERNQNGFINALDSFIKRVWWLLHVHRSVSRTSPMKKLRF